jgi:hypothetical protein
MCALDHEGHKPVLPVAVPVCNGQFTFAGVTDQTPYYLLEFNQ